MINPGRYFLIYHLSAALVGAMAEADGDEILSRRLNAQAKLRLITMSDEELQELARLVANPPERPAEKVYRELKVEIEGLTQMADDWIKELHKNPILDPKCVMNRRILIIENDPFLKTKLVSVFIQAGFTISDIPEYSQALQKIDEFKPDLIVMETMLPDIDGFKACREVRHRFNIPVILLGHDSSDQVWTRVMEADADHYEVKPCRYLALVAQARTILRRNKPASSKSGNESAP